MPIRNKLRKSNSATTASECSKELRDLPDDDYNQLLASVANWPKKVFISDSGVLSPGAGADEGKSGKKLTPAAQSCLDKIFDEVRSVSIGEPDLGTFPESSSFMSRRVDAYSAFTPTKKKPVRYEKEDMKYIDEDNDVELMDLSGTTSTRTFIRGNREHTATEYTDTDVEMGSSHCIDDSRHSVLNGWNEKALLRNGRLLNQTQTILGPHSEGAFYPIKSFVDGTDEIPSLTPVYEMPPHSKSLLPTPQEELSSPTEPVQHQNGVTNNIEDVIAKNAIQDVVVPTTKSELGKRKKSKKDKSKENVIMAENVPGHMGQLPVEQLVDLIEGKPEQNNKKQSAKDKSEVATDEATIQTKKERRRKSKELKEAASPSASNAATIGASQTKTGGSTAAATAAAAAAAAAGAASSAAPANTSQPPKMEFTVASKRVTSPGTEKRRGKGGAGGERNVRCSTEDAEEEFLSADEGVASSIGDDPSVPASMVASLAINSNSPKGTTTSDVVLDGRNYRADDEDVTQIERQFADEQEFITVNTKKKKSMEFNGKQQQQQRTGSAGKDERHQRAMAERLEPARRSSLGITAESRNSTNGPSSGRRPTTASLADFLDEKDGGRVHSKPTSSTTAKTVKKVHRNENSARQSQPDVEVSLPELPSGPAAEQMSKPAASQSVNSDSPERTFSYADAAKKSSEPSRDNSPACVAVASPSAKSDSPAPQTPTPLNSSDQCGAEVLPCADVAARGSSSVADGLSFFYDESEAAQCDQDEEDGETGPDGAFVLNLAGKTVRFAKGMASPAVDTPPSNSRHMCMVEMLAQRWKMFQEGNVPKIYQPRIASS
ncbi:unnamed protein product [Cylicocyclus nassatus]|uniref:Uncharacterized protein n=1 Tax=Cylicocyclus nassatus TaxID=53992 RepID=A0AA36GXE8_CYLNA|nr:unnamed protein product [Cylicocyclus nassatus]